MDWIADLESVHDESVLRAAFEPVLSAADYIEAPSGSVALAAAEVVAALCGKPRQGLPPEVVRWVDGFGPLDDERLVEHARRAVSVVADDSERSELRQLWDEAAAADASAWRGDIDDLRSRLA
jgi:hypothetical protein